jgi:hypothetical protein
MANGKSCMDITQFREGTQSHSTAEIARRQMVRQFTKSLEWRTTMPGDMCSVEEMA